jgi:hypothetical protein
LIYGSLAIDMHQCTSNVDCSLFYNAAGMHALAIGDHVCDGGIATIGSATCWSALDPMVAELDDLCEAG